MLQSAQLHLGYGLLINYNDLKLKTMSVSSNKLIITVCSMVLLLSCKKDFLDAKPNVNMVVPKSLNDFQSILDNAGVVNLCRRTLPEITNDNLFVPDNIYLSSTASSQSLYIWKDDADFDNYDWSGAYSSIFIMNSVLESVMNVVQVNPGDEDMKKNIKGSALFHRGMFFWDLLQNFAPVYETSAGQQPGIILPLTNNVQERLARSNLEQSYQQVLNDLREAIPLLPEQVEFKTRPNRCAGYAAMARVYLSMGVYQQAGLYADSALQLYSTLINYNSLNKPVETSNPFIRFNDEVIFQTMLPSQTITSISANSGYVDTTLYNSYVSNDLRKKLFFASFGNNHRITGRYSGTSYGFGGMATDELYLTRAECRAHVGDLTGAMQDLNTLMVTRWKAGTYVPATASTETQALQQILSERRKQLLMRGLRWTDLKRLNLDSRFAVTLKRVIAGTVYTLPPGDPRYLFLIPSSEILLNQLVSQNPR